MQEVMAAISTSPFLTSMPLLVLKVCASFSAGWLKPLSAPVALTGLEKSLAKVFLTLPISMRSCGRFGPASEGATDDRSSVCPWRPCR